MQMDNMLLEGLLDGLWFPRIAPLQSDGCGPAGDADGGELTMGGGPAEDISLVQVRRGAHVYIY